MTIDAWFEFDRPVWEKDTMSKTADTILLTEKDKQRLEKIIEVSKAALEGQEIECFEYNGANKSWHQANCVCWNWRDYDYRIKPPDPEPLECWVAHQDATSLEQARVSRKSLCCVTRNSRPPILSAHA